MGPNYTSSEIFLWNFYIADLNRTTFEHVHEVPNMVSQMVPFFFVMIVVEHIILIAKGKPGIQLGDGISSVSLGLFMETVKLLSKGLEMVGYQWLYQYRLFDLDWQSPFTWWAASIAIDFGYYWTHRASHEINWLWAGHQVHHSSEELNLTAALRQSAFRKFFCFGFYQPMALLGIPLPAMLVHFQFSLFYQFWIHTELIPNLGPLEWIFNTASHHRVHHGINKWCLDKNYAAFLIIWDRMFGTFEAERKEEKIVYGLVEQPQSFETCYLQLYYYKKALEKSISMSNWKDSLKAIFYGPGWFPGTPRLGDESALPERPPSRKKYSPKLSFWLEAYVVTHFVICIIVAQEVSRLYSTFNWFTALAFILFIFLSLSTFGSFYDGKWWTPAVEFARCLVAAVSLKYSAGPVWGIFGNEYLAIALSGYFALSSMFWASQIKIFSDVKREKAKTL